MRAFQPDAFGGVVKQLALKVGRTTGLNQQIHVKAAALGRRLTLPATRLRRFHAGLRYLVRRVHANNVELGC